MYKYLCASILVLENRSHSNHTVLQYNGAHQYHRSDTDKKLTPGKTTFDRFSRERVLDSLVLTKP